VRADSFYKLNTADDPNAVLLFNFIEQDTAMSEIKQFSKLSRLIYQYTKTTKAYFDGYLSKYKRLLLFRLIGPINRWQTKFKPATI